MHLVQNYDLTPHNTLRLPARAAWFTRISSVADIKQAVAWSQQQGLQLMPLGQGSNLVLTRDMNALVAHIAIPGIRILEQHADWVTVQAGAGVLWDQLVCYCLQHDLSGIENLTLIPGTVGAAPVQNIGAYGVELQDVLVSLTAIDQKTGIKKTFRKTDCCFAYRYSIFKEAAYQSYIICDVTLRLARVFAAKLDYPALAEQVAKTEKKHINAMMIRQWIKEIRQSKLPDPAKLPNAGSFFHNPVIRWQKYQQLKQTYTNIPGYAAGEQKIKIPAGWLIEKTGLRGFRDTSGAGVHTQQALVLVNYSRANGKDIMRLADKIRDAVWNQFAIHLAIEPLVY